MTSTISIDKRYGAITAMGGPNPSPLIAVAGPYHRILHAEKSGERVEFLGESEDLGAEVLAVNNETIPNFHVLTAAGAVVVDNADAPQIVTQSEFDPGDGRWLWLFGGTFLATPLARGGVQVVNATTLAQISQMPGVLSDSRFAANFPLRGYLWVADGKQAQIGVFKVSLTTGALTYVGKVRAPNCRDIIKVVFDDQNGNLFVVCRRRIVRFVAPLTEVDEPLPVFAEDYGIASADYTDFVVLGENQYWIGQNYPTSATPLDHFHGPLVGVWDSSLGDNGELIVAAPQASLWTVNNAIPYYTEDTIDETVDPPVPPVVVPPVVVPPVILPSPPVITSTLTASLTEDTLFSYTITATGMGPITYGVTAPPSWLTSIHPLTGAISGTPPDAGTVNISITATNAGGTTTATLVVTVQSAIANMSQVDILNGGVSNIDVDGNLVYVVGTFTSVKDASGTYTRNRAACLDKTTGLWTSWNPNLSSTCASVAVWGSHVYLGGSFTTVGGLAKTNLARVNKTTGALDTGWSPLVSGSVDSMAAGSTRLYMVGAFVSFFGNATEGCAAIDGSGNDTTWRPIYTPAGTRIVGAPRSVCWTGTYVAITGAAAGGVEVSNGIGGHVGRGLVIIHPTTNEVQQCTNGINTSTSFCCAWAGQIIVGFGGTTYQVLPLGTASGVTRNRALGFSDLGAVTSFNPNLPSLTAAIEDAISIGGSDKIIVGAFTDVGGNATYRLCARVDSSGAVVPAFSVVFGSAANPAVCVRSATPAVVIGGTFDTTINGVAKKRLAFLNSSTGALY